MDIGELIALVALIFSLISLYMNQKNTHERKEREKSNEIKNQENTDRQIFTTENGYRVSLMPHFHLSLKEEIFEKLHSKENLLILPITLVNISKETAANIQIVPLAEQEGMVQYFKISNIAPEHYIHDYLDNKYAMNGEKIKFTVCCPKHDKALDVVFKIRFNDLVGRNYEQEFRFQYSYYIGKYFSLNSTSNLPICIKNKDKTGDLNLN